MDPAVQDEVRDQGRTGQDSQLVDDNISLLLYSTLWNGEEQSVNMFCLAGRGGTPGVR